MIKPTDLGGDADLARRVIVVARTIAPCLDSLVDGAGDDDPKYKSDAIAILKGVIAELTPAGIKSQGIGTARIEYIVNASSFSADYRAGLRSLCELASGGAGAGLSRGSFPPPSKVVSNLWPDGC